MNALIIEDDELKMERLRTFLTQVAPDAVIELARSYKSGLRALVTLRPRIALVDMTLPSFDIQPGMDGGRPLSLGGKELLRQMKRRGATCPVVVVTGFDSFGTGSEAVTLEQLDDELRREFSEFYLGSVYFNATTEDWRDRLRELVVGALAKSTGR